MSAYISLDNIAIIQGFLIVTRPELGIKRVCASCGAKFYDLHKAPIVCPKCETAYAPPQAAPARSRRVMEPAPVEPAARPEAPEADLVSLEDADNESEGTKAAVAEEAEDEADEKLDGEGFIVPEEQDEDDDVGAIVGDGINKDDEI